MSITAIPQAVMNRPVSPDDLRRRQLDELVGGGGVVASWTVGHTRQGARLRLRNFEQIEQSSPRGCAISRGWNLGSSRTNYPSVACSLSSLHPSLGTPAPFPTRSGTVPGVAVRPACLALRQPGRHPLAPKPESRASSRPRPVRGTQIAHRTLIYHDAQLDDARYTLFLARTAASHAAVVANRARVTSLLEADGRIIDAQGVCPMNGVSGICS